MSFKANEKPQSPLPEISSILNHDVLTPSAKKINKGHDTSTLYSRDLPKNSLAKESSLKDDKTPKEFPIELPSSLFKTLNDN